MQKSGFSPWVAISLGVLAVSTAAIFIRFAQDYAPSLTIAAGRLSLAALMLAPFALKQHRAEYARLSVSQRWLAVLAGAFLAFHFASWITSLEYTSVVSSVVLVTTTPLWVALLSPVLLGERLPPGASLGLLLALAGGIVVGLSDACTWESVLPACPPLAELFGAQTLWGNFLALFGAWMAAGYLIVGRRVRGGMSLIAYVTLVYGIAAVFLLGMLILAGQTLLGFPPQLYLWLFLLALIPQVLGHSIFNWALRFLPAALVAVTLLGEPIGSTLLAMVLLNEYPKPLNLIGAILILIGIYVTTRSQAGSPAQPPDAEPNLSEA